MYDRLNWMRNKGSKSMGIMGAIMKNQCTPSVIISLLIITTGTAYGMKEWYEGYSDHIGSAKKLAIIGVSTVGVGAAIARLWNKFFPPAVTGTFDAKYLEITRPDQEPLKLIVDYKDKKAYATYSPYDVQTTGKNENGEPVWRIILPDIATVEYNPKTDTSVYIQAE
jgi:hypothetical protein